MPDLIVHHEWCDANGCRCGKCPCLGPPWCTVEPETQEIERAGFDPDA